MESSAAPTPGDRHQRSIDFLYGLINYEKLAGRQDKFTFRLNRMRDLLCRLDLADLLANESGDTTSTTPQQPTIPTVHIAGTKGKGSTATMIASMLTASGFRTGLYTSPHVHDLEERFRVDGRNCPQDELSDLVDTLRPICDAMNAESVGGPTFFETTTAMALLHFRRSNCDAQVLEVGLGGRLDSTNVVCPSLSIITSIGLDHQHVLGDTLDQIAREKAGILKTSVPVISGVREDEPDAAAANAIRMIATQRRCPLEVIGKDFDVLYTPYDDWGSEVRLRDRNDVLGPPVQINVEGRHQAINASLALRAIQKLSLDASTNHAENQIDLAVAANALAALNIIGRLERFDLPDDQTAIVDTAHNRDSIDALTHCLKQRFRASSGDQRRIVVIFGSSCDKDSKAMLQSLQTVADHLVLTRFHGNPRYLPIEQLEQNCSENSFTDFDTVEHPDTAIDVAKRIAGPGGVVVVCGSFFLADETRRRFAS